MKLYRFLTGPDDAAFCKRITRELNRGWTLYGNPTLTAADGQTIAGQALVKEVPGDWHDDIDLPNA